MLRNRNRSLSLSRGSDGSGRSREKIHAALRAALVAPVPAKQTRFPAEKRSQF